MRQIARGYFTKKRLIEFAVIAGGLLIVALGVQMLSPYSPQASPENPRVETPVNYYRGDVVSRNEPAGTMTLLLRDGPRADQEIDVPLDTNFEARVGETVVVLDQQSQADLFAFTSWRIPAAIIICAFFFGVVALIGRRRGVMSVLGLVVSIGIVAFYIIPAILGGANAFIVMVSGAFMIAVASIMIAHGWNRRTVVSVVTVMVILLFVVALSYLAVWFTSLSGIADETSNMVSQTYRGIDMRGLFAGALTIATLGILDDVVTSQVAVIDELKKANRSLGIMQLYRRGINVGREHIAALINTLALAYIGVSLPTILLSVGDRGYDSWLLFFNSEYVVQEIVRTVVSSTALVVAVPLSTFLAALLLSKWAGNKRLKLH